MTTLRRIAVFAGSAVGADPAYRTAAEQLGRCLVRRGLGLVYGGGSIGLMGVIADTVLAGGGDVIGVIPDAMAVKEITHANLSELHVVPSMHARKALMVERADAFVALPGGIGTFEELFEVFTWAQLGFHRKPVGVLDTAGYYAPLVALLDHAVAARFLKPKYRRLLHVETDPEALLDAFAAYEPPPLPRWLRKGQI